MAPTVPRNAAVGPLPTVSAVRFGGGAQAVSEHDESRGNQQLRVRDDGGDDGGDIVHIVLGLTVAYPATARTAGARHNGGTLAWRNAGPTSCSRSRTIGGGTRAPTGRSRATARPTPSSTRPTSTGWRAKGHCSPTPSCRRRPVPRAAARSSPAVISGRPAAVRSCREPSGTTGSRPIRWRWRRRGTTSATPTRYGRRERRATPRTAATGRGTPPPAPSSVSSPSSPPGSRPSTGSTAPSRSCTTRPAITFRHSSTRANRGGRSATGGARPIPTASGSGGRASSSGASTLTTSKGDCRRFCPTCTTCARMSATTSVNASPSTRGWVRCSPSWKRSASWTTRCWW